ncbi:hypothetical protein BGZ70_003222 [Mortierella alpina]|uniref:P-loop containing nucleoside triphosphate hydrolase protein n=1 Tax=Mortierella alpina TaxID=64518 RepID=A0A9P6M537_MORAP|nr:hypothetical protein BGZ70_003222 [Mortierella alpina]
MADSASSPLLPSEASLRAEQTTAYGTTTTAKGDVDDEPDCASPEAKASLLSLFFLSWMDPLFKTGYRRQIQEGDISEMLPKWKTDVLGQQLHARWEQEKIIKFLKDTQSDSAPPPSWHGYGFAFLLLATCLLQSILAQIWVMSCDRSGQLLRNALVDMVFRKATVLSSKARLEYPDGTIFNLMSTDTSRIGDPMQGIPLLVAVPLATITTVGMLWYLMGPSALVGTILLMTVNPMQAWAMTKLSPIREKSSKIKDTRIRVMTEILQGIKVIKFFTFEPSFLKTLSEIRLSELKCISYLLQVRGFIYSTSSSLPIFASALSFVLYAALGNKLEPEIVFPALALFTGLRVPLLVLPYCYSEASDALVSVRRIEKFLLAEEAKPLPPVDDSHEYALSIEDADFYWDQLPQKSSPPSTSAEPSASTESSNDDTDEERRPLLSHQDLESTPPPETKPFLRDINIHVPRNSLVAIVGPVGSGKSSLLQAMVGNMNQCRGNLVRGASIGYASQTPWIQNATIRENILFDTPMDEDRYWRVVKACSLERDLEGFKYQDETLIGERGVNLSGGQKARLSLARSVYYGADTVIMDDPLSAVDAHVGRRLWEDCILQELRGKTRIMATHQLHVLPDVDYVICMKDGRIAEQGKFDTLMAKKGDFYTLMRRHGGHHDETNEDGTLKRRVLLRSRFSARKVAIDDVDVLGSEDDECTVLQESEEPLEKTDIPQNQMVDEERAEGAVSSDVYRNYFKLGGRLNWAVIVFLLFLQQGVGVTMNVWLSFWSEDRFHLPTWTYIDIYVGTAFAQLAIVMLGSFMLVVAVIKSAKVMHDEAFVSVLQSPMAFFDTTPLGRILNRQVLFSKDTETIDNTLMGSINQYLITITGIISVLVLSAVFLPLMIPVIIPLAMIYYAVARFYQRTNRELKRLEAIMRSHLYSYFSETLTGMGTLRAYHQHGIDNAIHRNQCNTDRHAKVLYHFLMGMRWVGIRAFTIGHVLNFVAVVLIISARGSIEPATAGLVLSYLARLASEMSWAVQCTSYVENNMNAAERLMYYANCLEHEPPAEIADRKPNASWPSEGHISFQSVTMRYREGLPLVLNRISFEVPAGHNIGVVGRTGAGKSSLIQALFRLVDLDSGCVVIDGIDTSTIGTADLRSKIAIIPQDPVLFHGTFRYNLDPLSRHTEQELWKALETSDLKVFVQQQDGGLDGIVTAHGENLSVGQRQLMCLSRALLAKSKIVVLDEATASVDLATDSLIQKAIRVDFADSTVVTIAHRLNTVVDYHRILVMDQGQVAEFDTPRKLLQDRSSMFSKMVDETGPSNAALLRSLAGC